MMRPDYKVREMAQARPRLRADLRWTLQRDRNGPYWVMEDPIARRFFRIGVREKEFLCLLDGTLGLNEAVARHAALNLGGSLPESAASATLRWLVDQGLLESAGSGQGQRLGGELRAERAPDKVLAGLGSILFLRIPLGSPDRLLGMLLPPLRWTFSWGFFLLWLGIVGYASIRLAAGWKEFAEEGGRFLTSGNPLIPLACWAGLKILHELWHGLACKRFGGEVPDAGVILLLFVTPMGYVDASSSLRFSSRRERMIVAAAGMFIELLIAAIAYLIWERAEPGHFRTILQQIVFVAGIGTVLFNLNPLMRFDGYYLLSDLTGVSNLFSKGQTAASQFFERLLLGRNPAARDEERHPLWLRLYGIAAMVWKWIISLGIMIAAVFLFRGAGVVIAGIAMGAMLIKSIRDAGRNATRLKRSREISILRAMARGAIAIILLLLVFFFVPVKRGVAFPGIVEFAQPQRVRAECPGFVTKLHVNAGDAVSRGQVLVELDNPDELAELGRIRNELARSELTEQAHVAEDNIAGAQAQQAITKALQVRLAEQERYTASLVLRAETDGVIHGLDLDALPGRFLQEGMQILTVAPTAAYRLLIAVAPEEEMVARENVGLDVFFLREGTAGKRQALLALVEPRATNRTPHWALAASSGGPLAEDRALRAEEQARAPEERAVALALPVFRAVADIPAEETGYLMEGGRVTVLLPSSRPITLAPLAARFWSRLIDRGRGGS